MDVGEKDNITYILHTSFFLALKMEIFNCICWNERTSSEGEIEDNERKEDD